MILSRLTDHLRSHGRASLADLARALDTTPDALEGMLKLLERKGQVRRLEGAPCPGGCCKCDPATLTLYEWAGR
ncbi:FeoC-like transcriptional regulator [Pseudothauera rhizosphaerae]|uniref:Sugar metabolism transcriptional regulator n=1 Tax=Pseudothauera rhizosphaerae TaxID=2565932 RepID=A0A4S4AU23_9RHOO|nr:FeoC-like transcriptional regulator [Pseudothauera rhizosphaerae]THF63254.1 sugar metabolism transcriptional regulator [Pseudothauera rhizosphaerae]